MCQEPGMSEARARDKAQRLTQLAARKALPGLNRKRKAGAPPAGESVATWAERWFTAREQRGLTSVDTDRGRFGRWIAPHLGSKPLVEVTRDDIEALVEHLDTSVRAKELSWKSAINVWGTVAMMFKDACSAKVRALRVRSDNPAAGVVGPDRGIKKAKAYLYPSEFLQLVSCEAVPLTWRRAIALSAYLYVRAGELRALEWEDVDVARGTVHVHRGLDREGRGKATKTGVARRIPVEPALLPLLRAMQAEGHAGARVIRLPDDRHLARALRGLLEKAGLTRADLYASDATRKAMTWHDLRATGLTWLAVRGDDPLKIKQRAGHATFSTTEGYIREAEALHVGFGDVFPQLPADLLVGAGDVPPTSQDPPVARTEVDLQETENVRSAEPETSVESSEVELSMRDHGGGAGNRTRVRKASRSPSFTCVAALP
jgi:integrase